MLLSTTDGEKVYEIFSPNSSWDGVSLSGKEVPEGVYFYVLSAMGVGWL